MGKTIVVTGSAGFVGKALCNKLRVKEYSVIEVDISLGHWILLLLKHLLAYLITIVSFIWQQGHLYQILTLCRQIFYETNLMGTLNALESARNKGAKMIFISSYLYGTPSYLPVDEKPYSFCTQSLCS